MMKTFRKINSITLKRRQALNIPSTYLGNETDEYRSYDVVFSLMENIASLGYTFDNNTIMKLINVKKEYIGDISIIIVEELKTLVGDDVVYRPMYPGFPQQVRDMNESEFYLNAIIHYISGGTIVPDYDGKYIEIDNVPLKYNELKQIKLIEDNDVIKIFTNIISSKTSISDSDKTDLQFFFEEMYDGSQLPEIQYKENLAIISKLFINNSKLLNAESIKDWYKTATDVLRLYVALSDGDVSLIKPTKFCILKRRQYKLIMDLLNNVKDLNSDFVKYKEYWKRAGEKIYPNSFSKKKYAKVQAAFFIIRNNVKVSNWTGTVNKYFDVGNYREAINLLATRPGEFARRLDYILRTDGTDKAQIVKIFHGIVDEVSTPVLLKMTSHFNQRLNKDKTEFRVFFPKTANGQKCFTIENNLADLPEKETRIILKMIHNSLVSRFSKLPYLGDVFIDDSINGFLVPFSQRSASNITHPCVRGSRFKLKENTTSIRPFIWWTNEDNGKRVDLDLSASVFDENINFVKTVSYYSAITKEGVHSGDITNGGPYDGLGASEFIELGLEEYSKNRKARYIVISVHCYSSSTETFNGNFKCKAGFMELEAFNGSVYDASSFKQENEIYNRSIFDASRVDMKMDITPTNNGYIIPFIYDIKTREIIWVDMAGKAASVGCSNNVASTITGLAASLKSMINTCKPSLRELIDLHVEARGNIVFTKEEADTIFSMTEGITPFDIDIFASEYLS